jgi:hypothetical protein
MSQRQRRPAALGAVLACSMTLASCGGATPADSSNADGGNSGVEICDGSAGVRLAAFVGGGGPVAPGLYMLGENGWNYLLVSGRCEAWVLKEPVAPLRHVVLSKEQANSLASDFRLGEWNGFPPAMGGCPDGSGVRFRYLGDEVSGVPCGLMPSHPLSSMSKALAMQVSNLYAAGSAVEGDARYLLASEDPDSPRDSQAYRNASVWPLSSPADTVAIPSKDLYRYQRGGSRRASAEEASLLRALRTSWLEGAIGWSVSQFIPIVQADGARYQLYVRDSCPWENESGLLPDDLTHPRSR